MKGVVEQRHEADGQIALPGDAVLVHRGVDRSLTMACPDGCGEMLTVNLDRRGGPAWRFYREPGSISLFPSVWRTTGCKSHFIVWRSRIYWCDLHDELETTSEEFEQIALAELTPELQDYTVMADQLGAVPWAVLVACNRLVGRGLAQCGLGEQRHFFRAASHAGAWA
jgi:hypothetical protein